MKKVTDADRRAMFKLHKQGLPRGRIAEITGWTVRTVEKALAELRNPKRRKVPEYTCPGCNRRVYLMPCMICDTLAARKKTR